MQVLVIDDDTECLQILEIWLTRLGCRSLLAPTAADGLRLAVVHLPALILLDLELSTNTAPIEDGAWFLERLRGDPVTAGIAVAVHSASVYRRGEIPEHLMGVHDHLAKPFTSDQLGELIARHGFVKPPSLTA